MINITESQKFTWLLFKLFNPDIIQMFWITDQILRNSYNLIFKRALTLLFLVEKAPSVYCQLTLLSFKKAPFNLLKQLKFLKVNFCQSNSPSFNPKKACWSNIVNERCLLSESFRMSSTRPLFVIKGAFWLVSHPITLPNIQTNQFN